MWCSGTGGRRRDEQLLRASLYYPHLYDHLRWSLVDHEKEELMAADMQPKTGVTVYFRNRRKIYFPDAVGTQWVSVPTIMALSDPWGRPARLLPMDAVDCIEVHLPPMVQRSVAQTQAPQRPGPGPRPAPAPEPPEEAGADGPVETFEE